MMDFGVTPPEIPNACPMCEIGRDPATYVTFWCGTHEPSREGIEDTAVAATGYLGSTQDAGGDDNRLWCALLHRKNTESYSS